MIPSKEYGEPHRRYIDPDRLAGECDDQLPLISKVGRGPRGHGVTPRVRTDQPGEYVVEFVDDVTGEVVLSTANLSAGEVTVTVDTPESPVAGDTVMATIHVRLGDATRDYSLPIPPGATGSIFFEVDGEVPPTNDGTYRVDVGRLASWGNLNRPSRPVPRVNDMVVFTTPTGFAFGTIEAVENGQVIFTSRTGFELPAFGVTDDGHLTIDGEDTGVSVVGPAGKDAVSPDVTVTREDDGVSIVATDHRGTTEAKVLDGTDGVSPTIVTSRIDGGHRLDIESAAGKSSVDVMDGTDGEDGLPANMVTGTVYESDEPQVNIVRTSVENNVYRVDYGLPRGADGKSVNIHGGVYKIADLPDFDDTPVNDAFIVNDYEETKDHRYDLYIRGQEPVIAEEGGPWTVVEDWQGMPGFSIRYLLTGEIDETTPIQVAEVDVPTTFAPSAHMTDGDLVLDAHGRLGIVGSATDNNGYVTVTHVVTMTVEWDDISGKPTDLVHQSALDAEAAAREQADQAINESIAALPTTETMTQAIAAEASAREKADQLLETEVEGKLGTDDLVAGSGISISNDPESGHVTIAATGGGSGVPIATIEAAGIVKPDGTTITVEPDGTIHSVDGGSADVTDVVRFNEELYAYQKVGGKNTPLEIFALFKENAEPGITLATAITASSKSQPFFTASMQLDPTIEISDDIGTTALFGFSILQDTSDPGNVLTSYNSRLNRIDGNFVYNDFVYIKATNTGSARMRFAKFFTQDLAEKMFVSDSVWTMVPPTTIDSSSFLTRATARAKLLASDGWVDPYTLLAGTVTKPASGDGTSGQMLVTNGDGTTQWVTVPEGTAYTGGDGIKVEGTEIGILTSNVKTVAVGSDSGDVVTFNMEHVFGSGDGAMQGHSLRADAASFAQSGNTLALRDGGVATAKIADGAVTAEKIAAGVIPDTSGLLTQEAADGLYAAIGHTHAAATSSAAGFMSAADKAKLDGLSQYELPQATSETLGGVKIASDEDAKAFLGY